MQRVFATRRLPAAVLAELAALFELDVHDAERAPPREELLRRSAGASGLVTVLSDRVDAALLDAAGPDLRVVANHAAGVDNVDLEAAAARGVVVSNTPDVLTRATAELTIGLLLALARRIAEGDRLLRRGTAWEWAPTFMLGEGLDGKTLGVVGLGRIGREVSRLARALGMDVVSTGERPLADVLAAADAVTLHVPLTRATHHLVDGGALAAMRPGALLVNTARGPVVDESALVLALERGRLGGAALDVFEREPEVDRRLLALDNVVLTPHIGSATRAAREAMGRLCVEALRAVLVDGRRPLNAVSG